MENELTEDLISMKKSSNSDGEQSPKNTDINDPENLDYDEDHLIDQSKQTENHLQTTTAVASDEGELDEADLEDGEIHDPTASKSKSIDHEPSDSTTRERTPCRYFLQGRCHWGSNCKYIHPINETNKINSTIENSSTNKTDPSPPNSAGLSMPLTPTNNWISPQANQMNSHFFPNPMIHGPAPISVMPMTSATAAESAWERGLRSAKTLREQSMRRKQQDKDFNEKKFNLSLRDAMDEKEIDDHSANVDQRSSIDNDLDNVAPGSYGDRYQPYGYSNSRFSNRRSDPRDDYVDYRHQRKENSSIIKTKSRKDENPSYRRNSSHSQYPTGSHEETSRSTSYRNRRADDWHDPWERSKTHDTRRRSSRTGRERSYTSSSRSSSSSSRSSRSRSRSSSSSSRSRSRSRSRPKRRSHSVTRKTTNETVKNGNEKKSNGNKKVSSPSPTTKFLPGRQISSHTLKKAAKSSNSNHSSNHQHSTETRGKDSEKKSKKTTKKNVDRSDSSSSSSSSSDSDDHRGKRRSISSSSSDSSTSENESRKSKATKNSGATKKESPVGSTSKKRRDTSSSTGSTSVTKKSKLIVDSHPSSTEPINTESLDSNKKRR